MTRIFRNRRFAAFLREEDGATAIEYALIAGFVAMAIIVALTELGTTVSSIHGGIADKLNAVTTP